MATRDRAKCDDEADESAGRREGACEETQDSALRKKVLSREPRSGGREHQQKGPHSFRHGSPSESRAWILLEEAGLGLGQDLRIMCA